MLNSRPSTAMQIVDNVFVKMYRFANPGDTHEGHVHTFDHITLLASGKVLMTHDNGKQEFTAPFLIVTPAGIAHKFEALEPNTVFCCIHAIRDGDEVDDIADPHLTPEEQWNLLTTYPVIKVNHGH